MVIVLVVGIQNFPTNSMTLNSHTSMSRYAGYSRML